MKDVRRKRGGRGFTLVEVMLALLIGMTILGVALEFFSTFLLGSRQIADSGIVFSDFTKLRVILARDMAYADTVTVMNPGPYEGSTVVISGLKSYTSFRYDDTVSTSGGFVVQQNEPAANRFQSTYSYLDGRTTAGATQNVGQSARVIRTGIPFDLAHMELLDAPVTTIPIVTRVGPTGAAGVVVPIFSFDPIAGVLTVNLTYERDNIVPRMKSISQTASPDYFKQIIPFSETFSSRIWEQRR